MQLYGMWPRDYKSQPGQARTAGAQKVRRLHPCLMHTAMPAAAAAVQASSLRTRLQQHPRRVVVPQVLAYNAAQAALKAQADAAAQAAQAASLAGGGLIGTAPAAGSAPGSWGQGDVLGAGDDGGSMSLLQPLPQLEPLYGHRVSTGGTLLFSSPSQQQHQLQQHQQHQQQFFGQPAFHSEHNYAAPMLLMGVPSSGFAGGAGFASLPGGAMGGAMGSGPMGMSLGSGGLSAAFGGAGGSGGFMPAYGGGGGVGAAGGLGGGGASFSPTGLQATGPGWS